MRGCWIRDRTVQRSRPRTTSARDWAEASRRRDALACVAVIPAPDHGRAFADSESDEIVPASPRSSPGSASHWSVIRRGGSVRACGVRDHCARDGGGGRPAPGRAREGRSRMLRASRSPAAAVSRRIDRSRLRRGHSRWLSNLRRAAEGSESSTAQVGVRIGYYAVPNFAESAVDAVEMVVRAAAALRQSLASGVLAGPIQAFVDTPLG